MKTLTKSGLVKVAFWSGNTERKAKHSVQAVLGLSKGGNVATTNCGQGSCNCGGGCNGECGGE